MSVENPTAEDVITYSSGTTHEAPPDLRFVHYNDVYHVEPSSAEPVGGIARFQYLVNHYRNDPKFEGQPDLVTFFSGDAFNPSLESSVTKGAHMVPILNGIGTDVACVGNHDLDFGIRQYRHLTGQCKFPWLLANVLDPDLGEGESLANAPKTTILTSSNGIKIGVIGLGEKEWLDTINSLPPNLIYKSATQTAKELVPGLREQGCEIIVAVTHQREPNDDKLARQTDGLIDIILGGHDHYYSHSLINGTHVLRSGSDFKQLSYLEAWRKPDGKWDFEIVRRDVVSSIAEDKPTIKVVEGLTAKLKAKLDKPVGYTAAPLDARFTTVRTRESNIGNFVCDLMRYTYSGDCAIMAAGTIRGDQIYAPGVLRLKDIMNCFPFEDPVVVIKVKGAAIADALENSVSKYPALEGRFPQVSNIEFTFDPSKPPGSRVSAVSIAHAPLDPAREYTLVTRGYMARGKDGYDSLLIEAEGGQAKEIVSEENGILISMMLRQYFMSLKVLGRWKQWGPSMGRHWSGVQEKISNHHPHLEPQRPSAKAVERLLAANGGAARKSAQNGDGDGRRTPLGTRPEGAETPLAESETDETGTDDETDDEVALHTSHPPHHPHHHSARADAEAAAVAARERQLSIMRRVMRKWWRLTGLPGHPALCDGLQEGEFTVNWTKAIAPRLEGRIRMVEG
ncbi:Metallo-dependent phosphatase-like protein [Phyllosticta capitalensis]|uniref:Metallo-dependent phosphatase-like protein n=1 Tax=Phyllosticta capitalensis TaxID=121624 RepID=UPI0031302E3E